MYGVPRDTAGGFRMAFRRGNRENKRGIRSMLDNLTNTAEPTRFDFGRNWLSFIDVVDETRIRAARDP